MIETALDEELSEHLGYDTARLPLPRTERAILAEVIAEFLGMMPRAWKWQLPQRNPIQDGPDRCMWPSGRWPTRRPEQPMGEDLVIPP